MADDEVVELLTKIGRTIERESDAIRGILGWMLALMVLQAVGGVVAVLLI